MIGVLCTSYPRSPDDHAGSFVRTRVRALAAEGQTVEVIAAGQGSETSQGTVRVFRVPTAGVAEIFYAGGAPEALEGGVPGRRARAWLEAVHFTAGMTVLAARRAAGWSAVESHWLVPSAFVACAVAPHLHHRAHAHGGDVFLLARVPGGASLARLLCRSGAELVFASADLRDRFARLCGDAPEALGARTCVQPAPCDSSLFRLRPVVERHGLRSRIVLFTVAFGLIGFYFPQLWLGSKISRRQKSVRRAMPDALDLLTICVEAGLGFDAAMAKVSEKWENELSLAFARVIQEIQLGKLRREAMRDMADRIGLGEMTSFVAAVIQSEQLGVSMAKVLRIQSEQMRM